MISPKPVVPSFVMTPIFSTKEELCKFIAKLRTESAEEFVEVPYFEFCQKAGHRFDPMNPANQYALEVPKQISQYEHNAMGYFCKFQLVRKLRGIPFPGTGSNVYGAV